MLARAFCAHVWHQMTSLPLYFYFSDLVFKINSVITYKDLCILQATIVYARPSRK
jgi:hypothetical protein